LKVRRKYKVDYSINYKSGKNWHATRQVIALTEGGAIDIIRWLHSGKDVCVKSIIEVGFVGKPIIEDRQVLGDY